MPTTEKKREYNRRWKENNPSTYAASRARNLERVKEKYRTDPEFREGRLRYAKERGQRLKEQRRLARRLNTKEKETQRRYNTSEQRRRFYRNRKFVREYGMTIEEFEALEQAQGGGCAICSGRSEWTDRWNSQTNHLFVDHDHSTGKVRGLLCFHCNTGLGHFKDNPALLTKALSYLHRFSPAA